VRDQRVEHLAAVEAARPAQDEQYPQAPIEQGGLGPREG
jgi:hypothetical protein